MKLLTAKEENDQLFVNGYTSVTKANPDDLDFEPSKGPTNTSSDTTDSGINITLSQLSGLSRNQRVNVTATMTLGPNEPKEV